MGEMYTEGVNMDSLFFVGGYNMKTNIKYDANLVARYLLFSCVENYNYSVTQKKLHKLMYYSYQWYLFDNNKEPNHVKDTLFENSFQAWVHGPVLRKLYPLYADYGTRAIEINKFDKRLINRKDMEFLDSVCEAYGSFTASQLENMSHNEVSWQTARGNLPQYDVCKNRLKDDLILAGVVE